MSLTDEQVIGLFVDCRQRMAEVLEQKSQLHREMRLLKETMKSRGLEIPPDQEDLSEPVQP